MAVAFFTVLLVSMFSFNFDVLLPLVARFTLGFSQALGLDIMPGRSRLNIQLQLQELMPRGQHLSRQLGGAVSARSLMSSL